MAFSETGICNLALGQIGVGRIANIDGLSQVERDCAAIFDSARDEVIADFDWPFARKKIELAQLTTAPAFDYSYAYALPYDYIQIRGLHGNHKYEIVGDELHCDLSSDCMIVYSRRVKDPTNFSPKFVTALTHRLAAYLSNTIKKSHKMSLQWWDVYYATLPSFEAADARGEDHTQQSTNPYVDAR